MIHCRTEWQTTPIFSLREPHELYKKANRYGTERWIPQVGRCPVLLLGKSGGQLQIAPERMKLCSLGSHPRKLPKTRSQSKKQSHWLSGPVVQNPPANAGDTETEYLIQKDSTCRTANKPMRYINNWSCDLEPQLENHHHEKPSNRKSNKPEHSNQHQCVF